MLFNNLKFSYIVGRLVFNKYPYLQYNRFERTMAVFKQIINPINGQNEWELHDEAYDYHLEVANAGFGDMLHDHERNRKYFDALRKIIGRMRSEAKAVHVLDIGTGTGILAMMAAKAGADSVTACEAFLPMANCAERIIAANNLQDRIRLVKKRSTDIRLGVDMMQKANVLVAELLDTELIGEGAINIYNHAHKYLLTDDVICIPAKATCYAQVVQSGLGAQWNTLKLLPNLDGDVLLHSPKEIAICKGISSLHDMQLSQLPLEQFKPLIDPIEIFEFDFNSKQKRETERSCNLIVKSTKAGSTDLVFYWWDLEMDVEGDIVISCAPFWAHPLLKELSVSRTPATPLANVIPWRDHWIQAVYYISQPLRLTDCNMEFILNCNHDEFSFWFDVFPKTEKNLQRTVTRHNCSCNFHMTYSRSRIGQVNQGQRNKRYLQYLEQNINSDSQVLVLGDGCILGMATAALGAKKVWCYEPFRQSRHFMETLLATNKLKQVELIEKLSDLDDETMLNVTHIFAEPYYLSSILPWDNFRFGTMLLDIRDKLNETVHIIPDAARIYAVPVHFLDLHKIRMPVKECEGFDLKLFDEMIAKSVTLAQAKVEAQPLWEYPCQALAKPFEMLELKFQEFDQELNYKGEILIESSEVCNGICIWVDWILDRNPDSKFTISTGPIVPVLTGEFIKWDMFVRQGVHLISHPLEVIGKEITLKWSVKFKPIPGQINFNFDMIA